MNQIKDYPIGTKVKLEDDYPGEEFHEVAGHMSLCGEEKYGEINNKEMRRAFNKI